MLDRFQTMHFQTTTNLQAIESRMQTPFRLLYCKPTQIQHLDTNILNLRPLCLLMMTSFLLMLSAKDRDILSSKARAFSVWLDPIKGLVLETKGGL